MEITKEIYEKLRTKEHHLWNCYLKQRELFADSKIDYHAVEVAEKRWLGFVDALEIIGLRKIILENQPYEYYNYEH